MLFWYPTLIGCSRLITCTLSTALLTSDQGYCSQGIRKQRSTKSGLVAHWLQDGLVLGPGDWSGDRSSLDFDKHVFTCEKSQTVWKRLFSENNWKCSNIVVFGTLKLSTTLCLTQRTHIFSEIIGPKWQLCQEVICFDLIDIEWFRYLWIWNAPWVPSLTTWTGTWTWWSCW